MELRGEILKMKLISISPVMGFNLQDDAFESSTHLHRDWRTYVPLSIIALWCELNNYERHVIALMAYHQIHPFDK